MKITSLSDPVAAAVLTLALLASFGPASAADSAAVEPCRLLTRAEVAAVMPGAQAGKPERSLEAHGIRTCVWEWDGGTFIVQLLPGKHGAASELRSMASGYSNPFGRSSVRFENVPGVGEAALAAVEPLDPARGVIADMAVLTAQRGTQVMALQCAALGRGDRAAALRTLTTLARTAVARLPAL